MKNPSTIEVPQAFRDMAEQNVTQARQAYEQFMTMARQAQSMVNAQTGDMAEAAREVQAKTLSFSQKNMEAGFDFVTELSQARDLKQFLEIQSKHTEKSMKTYLEQAQELSRLMAEAGKKK